MLDISSGEKPYVTNVTQQANRDFALLRITTAKRSMDLAFTAYTPNTYGIPNAFETDALQAFMQTDGAAVSALYLAGGTKLIALGWRASITRSEPGLAFVEKLPDGTYSVGNPSPTKATVTVNLHALGGEKTFTLEAGETVTIKN